MPNEGLEKKAEKETYHCPVCKKSMENVDFTNAVYFLYNTLYLDDP